MPKASLKKRTGRLTRRSYVEAVLTESKEEIQRDRSLQAELHLIKNEWDGRGNACVPYGQLESFFGAAPGELADVPIVAVIRLFKAALASGLSVPQRISSWQRENLQDILFVDLKTYLTACDQTEPISTQDGEGSTAVRPKPKDNSEAQQEQATAESSRDSLKLDQGRTLKRSGSVFACEGESFLLNSTEALIAERLFDAMRTGNRWVDKADLLKGIPGSYGKPSHAFTSAEGKRFYKEFVTNDRRGHYRIE